MVNVPFPTVTEGNLLVQIASEYGDVVELDNGPAPERHLHSIFSLFLAVFTYDPKGSADGVHEEVPINYAKSR